MYRCGGGGYDKSDSGVSIYIPPHTLCYVGDPPILQHLLFPSHPSPHPSSTTQPALWRRAPGYSPPINNYSLCKAHTYANVLAVNRQLHGEMEKQKKEVVMEEVVLDVVSTAPPCCRPREMAKHLLAQWSRLWGSDTAIEACHYGILLERIGTVRVCTDGVECGRRLLRGELERGRGELRRIARRMG